MTDAALNALPILTYLILTITFSDRHYYSLFANEESRSWEFEFHAKFTQLETDRNWAQPRYSGSITQAHRVGQGQFT